MSETLSLRHRTIFARESRAKIRIRSTFLFSHFARKWGNNFHNLLAQVSRARVCTFFLRRQNNSRFESYIFGIIAVRLRREHRLMTEEIKVNSKKCAIRSTVQPSRIQLHSGEFVAQSKWIWYRFKVGTECVAYPVSSLRISFLIRGWNEDGFEDALMRCEGKNN